MTSAAPISRGTKQSLQDEWKAVKIGDICDIHVGRDLKDRHFSRVEDNHYKYPVYSNTVDNNGLYGFYNFAEYEGDSLTIVGRGVGIGTAFARSGGYGAIGRLLVLFPKIPLVPTYIASFFNCKVRIFDESSGIPQLTGVSLAKYEIPLPPLPEQHAIAKALSDVDELINSLDKLITKKRAIKQATMQQLLTGKTRLPGFSGEWINYKLGKIANLINGRAYSLSEWESTGTPVIRLQNLTGSGDVFYYSNLPLPEKQYCHNGDLLFMWSASFGPIIWKGPKAIFHYHIWKIECSPQKLNKNFLYFFLHDITERLRSNSTRSCPVIA